MRLHIAPSAEADLDEIWLYFARETGNLALATEIVESIANKFTLLTKFPFMGRSRKADLAATGVASL
jgi:plasmid stabilization system protein ParE